MAQHGAGLAQVGHDDLRVRGLAKQRGGVRQDHRVVVHVDHPGLRHDLPHQLMRVALGGQPGADVDELAQPLTRQPPGGALMKHAVGPGRAADLRHECPEPLT
jgi:hypothetical protein